MHANPTKPLLVHFDPKERRILAAIKRRSGRSETMIVKQLVAILRSDPYVRNLFLTAAVERKGQTA